MVGVDGEGLAVHVLLAEAGEGVDRGPAVRAPHPVAAGPPLELGGLGCVGERLAGAEEVGDVHAVVGGGSFGAGHGGYLLSRPRVELGVVAMPFTLRDRARRVLGDGWRSSEIRALS